VRRVLTVVAAVLALTSVFGQLGQQIQKLAAHRDPGFVLCLASSWPSAHPFNFVRIGPLLHRAGYWSENG